MRKVLNPPVPVLHPARLLNWFISLNLQRRPRHGAAPSRISL